jgi:flavin-dependent dehydrogenase
MERAEQAGVSLQWGMKDVRLSSDGVSLGGEPVRAALVIGADGQNSLIRRQAGLSTTQQELRRYGFRRHYALAPWSDYVELHFGRRGQIYITPTASEEVCVALVTRDPRLRIDEALKDFPELQQRLAGATAMSPERGALSVSRRLRRVQRGNVALVGDASGSVDATSGEGMCIAFRQALALGEAWRDGDLRAYGRKHAAIGRRTRWIARLLMILESHPRTRRRVFASLAERPEILDAVLAAHLGEIPPFEVWIRRLLQFGRGFVAA